MAERSCRATTSPSTACWSMTFPGWSESDERLRSGTIYIVGPQKHRSPADLGKFGRPKNVRRSFKSSEDRLFSASCGYLRQHTATFGYIRPLSREERRKSAAERPLSSRDRPFSASLGRTTREDRSLAREKRVSTGPLPCTCGYLRVLSHTYAPETCRSREERPRIVPPPWSIGRDSIGSKKEVIRTTIGPIKKMD